jgi:hypothetical protein
LRHSEMTSETACLGAVRWASTVTVTTLLLYLARQGSDYSLLGHLAVR